MANSKSWSLIPVFPPMHLIVLTLIFWLLIHLKYCLERVPWRSPTLLRVDFFVSTLYIKKIIFIFSSLNCFTTFLEINWSYSMGLFLLFPFPPIILLIYVVYSAHSFGGWQSKIGYYYQYSLWPLSYITSPHSRWHYTQHEEISWWVRKPRKWEEASLVLLQELNSILWELFQSLPNEI